MIIKTVKLKVSFDKSWGEINEKVISVCKWNSLGKTGSEKWKLSSQKTNPIITNNSKTENQ